jgi:hypothetical protein
MVFHLDDVPTAAAPHIEVKPPSPGSHAPLPAARPAAALLPAPLPAAAAQPPLPPPPQLDTASTPPAAKEQAADALQAMAPGLLPIRKAVMRGRGGSNSSSRRGPVARAGPAAVVAGGAKAWGMKAPGPLEQDWVPPGWTSPARASQAA